jgi:hypothetical protein
MEIKKVSGGLPEKYEYLQGGTFINILPVSIVDSENYEYYQMFTFETNVDILDRNAASMEKEIKQKYLDSTDWVKDYKLRHDLGLKLIPEDSSKWVVIAKREEYLADISQQSNELEAVITKTAEDFVTRD